MKLVIIAVSTLIGVASHAPVASAQDDSTRVELGRTQVGESTTVVLGRNTPGGPVPTLESDRPAAGALPQPPGRVRSYVVRDSNAPIPGADIRGTLRSD